MHLTDAFIQSDLQLHSGYTFVLISMCVPWESNPQPFALLTQCSTTEPHRNTYSYPALVQPALGPLCARCMTCINQCFVLFAGSEQSVYNDAQSRLADIIYSSQTELQKQVVMSDRAE